MIRLTRAALRALSFCFACAPLTLSAAEIAGTRLAGAAGATTTSAQLMAHSAEAPAQPPALLRQPGAPAGRATAAHASATAQWPATGKAAPADTTPAAHTLVNAFDSIDVAASGAMLANPSGAAGPSQVVVATNGHLRSYSRTGVADGVLDIALTSFFAPAMTPLSGSVVANAASTPNVRYDRFTARWILSALDSPCTALDCSTRAPNRVLLAVSDVASNGTISAATAWTFFSFQADTTNTAIHLSLGVDVNALYLGTTMVNSSGAVAGTNG